jgi:hypothetical protein
MATVDDTCDRHPSAQAYTAWYRPFDRRLVTLCAHCTNEHELALTAQGFELCIDDRTTLTPA